MKNLFVLMLALGSFSSCTMATDYSAWSDGEILVYNETAGPWDKIQCSSEKKIGSNIRKRDCATVRQLKARSEVSASSINNINYGTTDFFR
ncbi:MAG TPA: hypothetical protein EYG31_13340 [Porticoccaceae bacterium]|jgi:hypothetical protein|nr:hypothetical protein [Gammaproteobacteria bacterium]HIF74296.1 hypothetical protein [Gammaproteobacteria bacterium]HIL61605.1 hypothetical protein [Porticoccaceae bacterium]